jgi:NAD-dependent dihydropyrimidine dehydrogenase PreA subunit
MYRVIVKIARCENKGKCLEVCPTDVFDLVKPTGIRNPLLRLKLLAHGNRVAEPVRGSACIGCMLCVEACPQDAIKVANTLV